MALWSLSVFSQQPWYVFPLLICKFFVFIFGIRRNLNFFSGVLAESRETSDFIF